jgi:thioredoxin-like negative regulator of GroEL
MRRALVTGFLLAVWTMGAAPAFAESLKDIQAQGRAMVKDAEEMVMHGGMGDGKAILHHCAEVAKQAEAILNMLPPTSEEGAAATPHLQNAISYCKRVADMGDKVDPGASLNPAAKARAAVREAVKHLNALRGGGA